MARQPKQSAAAVEDLPVNGDALVAIQNQAAERISLVVQQFGDGLPFDQYRYEDKIRSHLSRSAEEMLAAGRALVVAREHLPHGEWGPFLERIGLEPRVAQRCAQAAIKFSNASTSTHLIEAAGSRSKLFELMVLDDEDIQQLNDGGTVAGLELDDISRMPISELRKTLREAREESKAHEQLLATKNAKIDKLQADVAKAKRRVQQAEPNEVLEQLRKEVTGFAFAAESAIRGDLHRGFAALAEHAEEAEGAVDNSVFFAGLIGQLERALVELRAEHGVAADTSATPAWLDGQE